MPGAANELPVRGRRCRDINKAVGLRRRPTGIGRGHKPTGVSEFVRRCCFHDSLHLPQITHCINRFSAHGFL